MYRSEVDIIWNTFFLPEIAKQRGKIEGECGQSLIRHPRVYFLTIRVAAVVQCAWQKSVQGHGNANYYRGRAHKSVSFSLATTGGSLGAFLPIGCGSRQYNRSWLPQMCWHKLTHDASPNTPTHTISSYFCLLGVWLFSRSASANTSKT